jgi:hypothetical protein
MSEDRKPQSQPKSEAERKQERLAAALRENLKRRKVQARAKRQPLTVESPDAAAENSTKSEKN